MHNSNANRDDVEAVINGLRPLTPIEGEDTRWTLNERMQHYRVPGVSLCVIRNGEIHWSQGFGVLASDNDIVVTETTLFQACSMSKPLAALCIMMLAEEGRLDIDAPINTQIRSWALPESPYTADETVTLRHILSHTGGLSVSGFKGYTPGADLPSTLQILCGDAPATSKPVISIAPPSKQEMYSGGGTMILQRIIEEQENRPFEETLNDSILSPLAMSRSGFWQPLPAPLAPNAARGHNEEGAPISGGWRVFPELAAAGLWTTAEDYARFMIALQSAHSESGTLLLKSSLLNEVLTPASTSSFGLGPEIRGTGASQRFGHSGGNVGYRCDSVIYKKSGDGAVVLTNGVGRQGSGWTFIQEIFAAIASVYNWPAFVNPPVTPVHLSRSQLLQYTGVYAIQPEAEDVRLHVFLDGEHLLIRLRDGPGQQAFPISSTVFRGRNATSELAFNLADNTLVINDRGVEILRAVRIAAMSGEDVSS